MSDDTESKVTEAPQTVETAEKTTVFGVPMEAFVKGGTHSSRHERHMAELHADAERRRDEQDEERRLALIPVEEGGAKMFTNQLTQSPEAERAYVLLDFVTPKGEPVYDHGVPLQCLADIIQAGREMALIIACPACKNNNTPLDLCQIKILQSNRHWELSAKRYGEPIFWTEGTDTLGKPIIKVYRSAGTVVESERFSCDCGWTARIYDNKIRVE